MNKDRYTIVQGIVISRKSLIELVTVAILLALGVNLIASYIITLPIFSHLVILLMGAILCFISMLYLLVSHLLGRRIENRGYKAFLIYNKKKNEIIPVPRYAFSEGIYRYMQSAFVENTALKTLWEKEPLRGLSVGDQHKRNKSAQLLLEAVEYFVLSRLSTHLTDYFADESFKKENLKVYLREDVPEVLLRNRFLEMFSRPMENRPAFIEKTFGEDRHGEIVGAYGSNGVIYERFDLVLPKESIVRRPKDYRIEIETKKLKMSVTVRFEGFNTVLPEGFEQYYLGIDDWQDITEYEVDIDIEVLMKLWAFFSGIGWEYHHWVDSFLNAIENDVSKDAFFDRLGWEAVYTLLQCFNRKQANGKE